MNARHAPALRGSRPSARVFPVVCLAAAALAALAADARANPPPFSAWSTPAPAFALPALDGGAHRLAAGDSRAVLVHFFATWCEPCREELPALQRFAQRAGRDIGLFVVSVAEPDPRVRRFFATMPVAYPVLLDRDRAVARGWGVATLPSTIALDSNLKPRLAVEAPVAWDEIDPAALLRALDTKQPK